MDKKEVMDQKPVSEWMKDAGGYREVFRKAWARALRELTADSDTKLLIDLEQLIEELDPSPPSPRRPFVPTVYPVIDDTAIEKARQDLRERDPELFAQLFGGGFVPSEPKAIAAAPEEPEPAPKSLAEALAAGEARRREIELEAECKAIAAAEAEDKREAELRNSLRKIWVENGAIFTAIAEAVAKGDSEVRVDGGSEVLAAVLGEVPGLKVVHDRHLDGTAVFVTWVKP